MKREFRFFALICALGVMSCVHGQEQSETAAHSMAQLMIAAMAPAGSGEPGYAWDTVHARVAPPVRWHGDAFEPAAMEGTGLQRNGSLEGRGWEFDVIVRGSHHLVRHFGIDVNDAVDTEALLAEFRAAGAEVSGAGDDETAMFYYVVLPGRETAQLEVRRTCTPYGSRAARHCRSIMTWNFELL
jgi:hypothetical protein